MIGSWPSLNRKRYLFQLAGFGSISAALLAAACAEDPKSELSILGSPAGSGGAAGKAAGNGGSMSGRGGATSSKGGTNAGGSAATSSGGESTNPPQGGATGTGGSKSSEGGDTGEGGEDNPSTTGGRPTGGRGSGGAAPSGGSGGSGVPNPPPPVSKVECPDIGLDPNAGTVRYVCDCGEGAVTGCVAGDDAAEGSAGSPWRTYEKARSTFNVMEAGDSIAFCRGGVFPVDGANNRWVNNKCRADQPCIVRDYTPEGGKSDLERPLFLFADRLGIAFDDPADSDHEEGYVFMNLSLRGNDTNDGFFVYNDVDDVLVCNVAIDHFAIGFHLEGSNAAAAGSNGLNERVTLRNSSVTNCIGQGFIGGGNGSAIEYTTFRNNGQNRAVLNHSIYLTSPTGTIQGMRVVGNELTQSNMIDGKCRGVALVAHGDHEGLLIDGNTVYEEPGAAAPECWGISVDTGYAGDAEQFSDITIRNNVVENMGGVGIGMNACANCVIENNIVIAGQSLSGAGISAPVRERESDDSESDQTIVRNNSVLLGPDTTGTGIVLGGEGAGHRFLNNAVYKVGTGNFRCFDFRLDNAAYDAIDHNVCFAPDLPSAEWAVGKGALADWQNASSFDENSLFTDPMFEAVSGAVDLSPQAGSPLINAGVADGAPDTDQQGEERPNPPSIGALEP
jgi:hypothetical protein